MVWVQGATVEALDGCPVTMGEASYVVQPCGDTLGRRQGSSIKEVVSWHSLATSSALCAHHES